MKRIIVISILLIFITANLAIAELTKQDLEKSLAEQEKRIKEYIDLKIGAVNSRIDAVEKTVNSNINAVEKTVDSRINAVEKVVEEGQNFLKWMIGILALVVVGGITLPPIWQERRERKASSFTQSVTAKLDTLIQRVAQLEQEVADLKRPKIYQHNPK
ncbi:hypothetical protein H8E77_35910 [bacterium]|nr:hypothetical protein [bacterium]